MLRHAFGLAIIAKDRVFELAILLGKYFGMMIEVEVDVIIIITWRIPKAGFVSELVVFVESI